MPQSCMLRRSPEVLKIAGSLYPVYTCIREVPVYFSGAGCMLLLRSIKMAFEMRVCYCSAALLCIAHK